MAKRSTGNPPSKRWRAFNSVELVADDEGKRRLSESAAPAGIDELRRNVLKIGGLGAPSLATLGTLNNGAKAKGAPIPIGSMYPLTGAAAVDGTGYKRGIELAIDEINAYGGILGRPLEPYSVDTKTMSAAEVTAAATFLIDRHKVHAVINGYNIGPNDAEYEPIADAGIIYLSLRKNQTRRESLGVPVGSETVRRLNHAYRLESLRSRKGLLFVAALDQNAGFTI